MCSATRFKQPDGSVSFMIQPVSPAKYAAGEVFLPSEARAPATATVNGIAVYGDFDGAYHNLVDLGDKGLRLDGNGVVSGALTDEAIMTHIMDLSTKNVAQTVDVQPGTTEITIDLSQGQIIELIHDENVLITFANVPLDKVTPIVIFRVKANNTTSRTLSFNGTLYTEGGNRLRFSNTANAIDVLLMYSDSKGHTWARNPVANFRTTTGAITIYEKNIPDKVIPKYSNKVATPGTIVSLTDSGSFITTDVGLADNVFTTPVSSINNIVGLMYYAVEGKTVSDMAGAVSFDCDNGVFGELLVDGNIDSITLENLTSPNALVYTILTTHDGTGDIYNLTLGTDFKYDSTPTLTQEPNGRDMLVISTIEGTSKLIQCFQNFKETT